jgi:hypothetical protein
LKRGAMKASDSFRALTLAESLVLGIFQ